MERAARKLETVRRLIAYRPRFQHIMGRKIGPCRRWQADVATTGRHGIDSGHRIGKCETSAGIGLALLGEQNQSRSHHCRSNYPGVSQAGHMKVGKNVDNPLPQQTAGRPTEQLGALALMKLVDKALEIVRAWMLVTFDFKQLVQVFVHRLKRLETLADGFAAGGGHKTNASEPFPRKSRGSCRFRHGACLGCQTWSQRLCVHSTVSSWPRSI